MSDLPLGVGLSYFSGLEPLLDSHAHLVNVLEVEPQTLWLQTSADAYRIEEPVLERLRSLRCAKTLHGIGFPVGGSRPHGAGQIGPLRHMAEALGAAWVSEHLNFNQAEEAGRPFKTGFLLPPRQTAAGVAAAAEAIRVMSAGVPWPLAFETGVNYLRPRRDELPDGVFVGRVAEVADCQILLDLHNVWTNERNGRQSVEEFLGQIPLDRVVEVHVAGGFERDGYWLDSHSGAVPEPLAEVAAHVLPRLPGVRALIFELFPPICPPSASIVSGLSSKPCTAYGRSAGPDGARGVDPRTPVPRPRRFRSSRLLPREIGKTPSEVSSWADRSKAPSPRSSRAIRASPWCSDCSASSGLPWW